MRVNNMEYFWELVKKEYIEIKYSWKQLLIYGFMFVFFFYAVAELENIPPLIPIDWNNIYYAITIFLSFLIPSGFLMESILSDKRNQTFERYFVSGNIRIVMFAKLSAMSILGVIPFIIFYIYLLFNDINIINDIFSAINTPLYFWICLCIITIVCFIFNDEKTIGFAGIPFMILMAGLLYLNDFLAIKYFPVITVIITIVFAVVVTFVAYGFYKKTKYFLKI